jgi:dTDP-D-glucose 4,6-dehydratase
MNSVFLVMSADPYDDRDREIPESAHSTEAAAQAECVRRFESTFGAGQWVARRQNRFGPYPSDYYFVEEVPFHV